MRIVKTLFKLLIIGLLVLISIAIGYYFAVTKDVSLQPEKLVLSDNALIIYDQHGSPVEYASAFNFKQTAKIEDIPLHTQLAFLQTEDKRFITHKCLIVRLNVRNILLARSAAGHLVPDVPHIPVLIAHIFE